MPEETTLAVAQLIEVDLGDGETDAEPVDGGKTATVQFNPETLKVAYANTVEKPDTAGSSAMQYIASSSTKLDLELWFDATVDPDEQDVRRLTADVHFFITPKRADDPTKFKVPSVRFQWGSFLFDGVVTTLNETLELFSHDGRPLRSRIALSFTAQNIQFRIQGIDESSGSGGVGQTPQTPVNQGDSIQQMAAKGGAAAASHALAAANGIENPRLPEVGTLIASVAGAAANASVSVTGPRISIGRP